jgi:hypothetical protein
MRMLTVALVIASVSPAAATAPPAGWPATYTPPEPRAVVARPSKPKPRTVVRKPAEPEKPNRCLVAIEAVGDQALTEGGARENAEKAWQQEMRFARGELYADPRNAQGVTHWCVKSSIGGGLFYRCRIRATACAPEPK